MRYFYDTEFIEDGRTIELISIGIVAEDGRTYYAVNGNVRWERLGHPDMTWIRDNVWKHIPTTGPGQISLNRNHPDVKQRVQIADEVRDFIAGPPPGFLRSEVELWADYGAYDHVALCQLWGRMIDLPDGVPMRTNDIIQLAEALGVSERQFPLQSPGTQHHALYDARHNMEVFNLLKFPQKVVF